MAFGGIALRDRIGSLDRDSEKSFDTIVSKLGRLVGLPSGGIFVGNGFLNEQNLLKLFSDTNDFETDTQRLEQNGWSAGYDDGTTLDAKTIRPYIEQIRKYRDDLLATKEKRRLAKKSLRSLLLNGLGLVAVNLTLILFSKYLSTNFCYFHLLAGAIILWSFYTLHQIYSGFLNE